ncbi:unnamed protein product, partial [Polarella glacialis]
LAASAGKKSADMVKAADPSTWSLWLTEPLNKMETKVRVLGAPGAPLAEEEEVLESGPWSSCSESEDAEPRGNVDGITELVWCRASFERRLRQQVQATGL